MGSYRRMQKRDAQKNARVRVYQMKCKCGHKQGISCLPEEKEQEKKFAIEQVICFDCCCTPEFIAAQKLRHPASDAAGCL